VRFQVLTAASMNFRVFWDVLQCFRGAYCLHHQGAQMMDAVRTSETSVNIYLTTLQYIPEDSKLHTIYCSSFTGREQLSQLYKTSLNI
jgi:hypothetical protein